MSAVTNQRALCRDEPNTESQHFDRKRERPSDDDDDDDDLNLIEQIRVLNPVDIVDFVKKNNISVARAAKLVGKYASEECVAPLLVLILKYLTDKNAEKEAPKKTKQQKQDIAPLLDELQIHCQPLLPMHAHDDPIVAAAMAHHARLLDAPSTAKFQLILVDGFLADYWRTKHKSWSFIAEKFEPAKPILKQARALYCLVRDHLPALRRLRPNRELLAKLKKNIGALTDYVTTPASREQLEWWQAELPRPNVVDNIEWLFQ